MNSLESANQLYQSNRITNYGRWLTVILLVAAVLRLGWAALIPVIPVSDSHAYDTFAQNIVAGHGYGWKAGEPSAIWPVGTSAVYAAIYSLFGHSYAGIVALNIAVGVATTWLIALLTCRWFGQTAALVAAALYACWPSQIQFTTVLASELLYNFVCLLCLAVWYSRISWPTRSGLSGVLFAAASYFRTPALLLPALLSARDIAVDRSRIVSRIAGLAIVIAVMAILIAPWSIRNTRAFGEFVVMSNNSGINLWMGNNLSDSIRYMALPDEELRGMNEAQKDSYLKREALDYIRAEPAAFVWRTIRKLVDLHSRETIGVHWNMQGIERNLGSGAIVPLKWLATSYWWFVLMLGVLGAVALVKSAGPWLALLHPFVLLWIYYALMTAVVVSQDRYHFPSIPSIAALGGVGVHWIAGLLQPSFSRR